MAFWTVALAKGLGQTALRAAAWGLGGVAGGALGGAAVGGAKRVFSRGGGRRKSFSGGKQSFSGGNSRRRR